MNREAYAPLLRLGLADPPMAVKFDYFQPAALPPLEADAHLSLCEMLRESQRSRRPFYFCDRNDETCVGKIFLGMQEMEPFAQSGQIGQRLGVFQEARANAQLYRHIWKMDRGSVNYVSFWPVENGSEPPFDPDVLVVSAKPSQAEVLLRAAGYHDGVVYTSQSTPVMGCTWFLIYPFRSGNINYVLPALIHGPHGRQLYPEDTVLVSIPYQWIPTVLENLAQMPIHLKGHESREAYYAEFGGILQDLAAEKAAEDARQQN